MVIIGIITPFILIPHVEKYHGKPIDYGLTTLYFIIGVIIVTILHELAHLIGLKYFAKESGKLQFLPSYFALTIIYNELMWNQYIIVALTPQILVEIPLIITYILTKDPTILLILLYHTLASLPDIVLSIKSLIMFKNCRFKLYLENNRVKGYYVIKPNNECIIYKI